ncbi:MAG: hypothetical protein H6658_09745 [Ardenticatenaceae bacterium]|nr:hypothetical protein [Ardenticatenaceae bacterium]
MKNISKTRLWQTVTTLLSLGWLTAALILVDPGMPVAPGGCSVPDGVCTTSIDV